MPHQKNRLRPHVRYSAGALLVASLLGWNPLSSQELPLKADLPDSNVVSCPEFPPVGDPTDEELAQATRLGSDADQALILGDQERARDLLARAVELNPSAGTLAYRYARIMDDLGDLTGAGRQFCRTLALGAGEEEADYARERLIALSARGQPQIPEEARTEFLVGVTRAQALRLEDAIAAFGAAYRLAPDWADAVYNRGTLHDRLGAVDAAVSDFRRYLDLRPDASDALAVSERIGQLQATGRLPTPGTALGLGLLMPGLGQFYSGRTLGGTIPAFAAVGAVGFGVLYKETTDTGTDRPFLYHGVAAAAAITFFAAVEAYYWANGQRERSTGTGIPGVDLGPARLVVPNVSARGPRLALNVVRLRF